MKRKQITKTIKDEQPYRRPRKKREVKKLPEGFRIGMPVKVSNPHQFRGFKLGVIIKPCEKDDGIIVYLTSSEEIAEYSCINNEQGGTITPILK